MPRTRGKATKACQTDPVYLTEDQVQNIVRQGISHLNDALKQLQDEVNDLKSNLVKVTRDNEALNNLQQLSEAVMEQLQERCESIEEENVRLQQQLYKCRDEKDQTIKVLQQKVDDLEQNNKMSHLRIAGLEEEEDEDVQGKVIDVAKQLKAKLDPKDIIDARRMGPGKIGKTRDILVKFASRCKRDIMYKNRKMLHQTSKPVFVNEDLTQRRSQLFYEARRLKKQGRVFGAWSQHGNILIKVKERSQPKAVVDYKDIMTLINDGTNMPLTNIETDDEAESSGDTAIDSDDEVTE